MLTGVAPPMLQLLVGVTFWGAFWGFLAASVVLAVLGVLGRALGKVLRRNTLPDAGDFDHLYCYGGCGRILEGGFWCPTCEATHEDIQWMQEVGS